MSTTTAYKNFNNTQSNDKDKGKKASDSNNSEQVDNSNSNLIGDTQEQIHHGRNSAVITPPQLLGLPNELVSLIIYHLRNDQKTLYECSLVCKQFYIITNPLLWYAPDIASNDDAKRFLTCLSDTSQQQLHTLGQYIDTLHLNGTQWTHFQLTRLLPHIPHLKQLYFYYNNTSNTSKGFQQAPQHHQQLSTTILQMDTPLLAQNSFSSTNYSFSQLCEFEWTIRNPQLVEWLVLIRSSCHLERLHINFGPLSLNESAITIIKSFDYLTHLHINHHTHSSFRTKLLVLPITTKNDHDTSPTTTIPWPNLTHLTLNHGNDIDDTALVQFIQTHPHLQELTVTESKHLTNVTLDAIILWLPRVTRVVLNGHAKISRAGIARLLRHCHHLEYLVMYDGSNASPFLRGSVPVGLGDDDCLVLHPWLIKNLRQSHRLGQVDQR